MRCSRHICLKNFGLYPSRSKIHDEAMEVGVGGELLGRGLVRDVLQQPRHDVAFQRLQQPLVDGTVDHEEGLAQRVS